MTTGHAGTWLGIAAYIHLPQPKVIYILYLPDSRVSDVPHIDPARQIFPCIGDTCENLLHLPLQLPSESIVHRESRQGGTKEKDLDFAI